MLHNNYPFMLSDGIIWRMWGVDDDGDIADAAGAVFEFKVDGSGRLRASPAGNIRLVTKAKVPR